MSENLRVSRRDIQAMETRQQIVRAARDLFAAHGYAGTSVAQIAKQAGVSVQTIYDSVGSKGAIVLALNDLIDEEGGVREIAGRMRDATEPVELIKIAVAITRSINEKCADIVSAIYSAASTEAEMRSVRDESRRRHRDGIGRLTKRLQSMGALRTDRTVDACADVIAAMTDPQVVRTFVVEYGWSWQSWDDWTVDAITALVLAPSAAAPATRRGRSR